ncbi:MAG: OsmC family protein [Pyrinomonadaceae bacterium]|nr:OsmC family protein [Pyrinomonadaceae bacterium]
MSEITVTSIKNFQNEVRYDENQSFTIDEPVNVGGDGTGPDPYTLLLAALGGCISMTVTMYAKRKGWPVSRVTVRLSHERVHAEDCAECEHTTDGFALRIKRAVHIEGELTQEQEVRLHEIALKCPLHRTLASEIVFAEMKD